MYNTTHPDPFAGQYPPPPPIQSPVTEEPIFTAPAGFATPPAGFVAPAFAEPVYADYHTPHNQAYPDYHTPQDSYVPPPSTYYPPQQSYYHTPDEERQVEGVTDYHNNNDQNSLDEYLRQEREEYMKHENKVDVYKDAALVNEPERVPMVQNSPVGRKERKRLEKLEKQNLNYEPYLAKPTVAPQHEEEGYKHQRPYEEKKSPMCCCYNPAITCCSFFCLLISVAFLAAGVAMMIASKVVTDKCNNQCSNVIDQAQNACDKLCSKVLHDGMLYGGVVVAALAGIAILWKLIMWTCAGYSKR